ncbi:MAG: lipoyl(octanoyl) transferase LipB [Gammaproteobacteria bacterium]|nr:lipoyl(octanoyl) transferase LipB [Gammaproteobacteria bacterium]
MRSTRQLQFRDLDQQDYTPIWERMRQFTDDRDSSTADEIWFVQHPAVFTQGQAGKAEHILGTTDIPVVQSDRGGQVTYHGPGQLVAYTLLDLRRRHLGIRDLVVQLEEVVVHLLADFDIEARGRRDAPGVYVGKQKIAALGLRVRRGCTYHGLSLNVDVDLAPFLQINPCGYQGLEVTSMQKLGTEADYAEVQERLQRQLLHQFG